MQSIKEIMAGPAISGYTGSSMTHDMVAEQIAERWGEDEVENYDPERNALTFAKWVSLGYRPKKKQKAIRSITIVEKKDAEGKVIKRFKRTVCLFYVRQVERIEV